MQIVVAAWRLSVQVEDAGELAELLRFAEEHYADMEMAALDPLGAEAIPFPLRVGVSYEHAEDTREVAASLEALHQLGLLTGQLSA